MTEFSIFKAKLGGYAVYDCSQNGDGYRMSRPTFAGSIDECLAFIREQMLKDDAQ